jgi:POT family proton-dependent oligopeptide transporter
MEPTTMERSNGSSLPTKVCSVDQLEALPDEYRSGDPGRPLLHTDPHTGTQHKYALRPLVYSASFVLILHLADSFSYFGLENIVTLYLVGHYDDAWHANMTAVEATSFMSAVSAVSSTISFLGGILADGVLGDYVTISFGAAVFYLPGVTLLAMTTIPKLLGPEFNQRVLAAAILVLFPVGSGLVRTVVNVFGAKQFHPHLQSDMIETYYMFYYQALNVGALAGGIILPLAAQVDDTIAYMIPVGVMAFGLLSFLLGSSRYVRPSPNWSSVSRTTKVICACTCKGSSDKRSVAAAKQLLSVVIVSALKLPFDIAYCQMTTVFSIQALAMRPAGFVDPAMMLNVNSISGLVFGIVVGSCVYPKLHQRGITLSITNKFAIGAVFGALAIGAAIIVDYKIHEALEDGREISVLWQAFNYAFIGVGELFIVTTSFEAAFVLAPYDMKGFASAINLFMLSGLPNYLSIGLYNAFSFWFPSSTGSQSVLDSYENSQLYNFLWVLLGFQFLGILINILPPVTKWVELEYLKASQLEPAGTKASKDTGVLNPESEDAALGPHQSCWLESSMTGEYDAEIARSSSSSFASDSSLSEGAASTSSRSSSDDDDNRGKLVRVPFAYNGRRRF